MKKTYADTISFNLTQKSSVRYGLAIVITIP